MAAPDSSAGGFRKADDRRASASTGGLASGPPGVNGCSTIFCSIASPWVSPIPMRFSGCSNALVPANPMPEAWPSTSPRSRAFPRKPPERLGGKPLVEVCPTGLKGLEDENLVPRAPKQLPRLGHEALASTHHPEFAVCGPVGLREERCGGDHFRVDCEKLSALGGVNLAR